MSRVPLIVVDGADGVGKTTQIAILSQKLDDSDKFCVYHNRLLGGSKDFPDPWQLKIREMLLDPDFPSDSVAFEEQLFAATDIRGLAILAERVGGECPKTPVAIQDRGFYSHIAYAMGKGMSEGQISSIHEQTLYAYRNFSCYNVVMLPEEVSLGMERVMDRNEMVTPRLENLEMQTRVIEAMNKMAAGRTMLAPPGKSRVVMVKRGYSKEMTALMIEQALQEMGFPAKYL